MIAPERLRNIGAVPAGGTPLRRCCVTAAVVWEETEAVAWEAAAARAFRDLLHSRVFLLQRDMRSHVLIFYYRGEKIWLTEG